MIDGKLAWVKSSYSGSQGGNCVEAAADGVGRVLVRDTKDRGGAMLEFRASRWREFSALLKAAMVSHLSNCPRSPKAGITPEIRQLAEISAGRLSACGDFFLATRRPLAVRAVTGPGAGADLSRR